MPRSPAQSGDRDFLNVANISSVFRFCDWFTQKRKAVLYKKFLREKHHEERFKKIPKPSETRWFFYRDVLASLLDQTDEIEEYLIRDGDFIEERGRLFYFTCTGVPYSGNFLADSFIHAHFVFARDILEIICRTNGLLQAQYVILPLAWHCIVGLKERFCEELRQMRNGRLDITIISANSMTSRRRRL